jgi:hypothetical protein
MNYVAFQRAINTFAQSFRLIPYSFTLKQGKEVCNARRPGALLGSSLGQKASSENAGPIRYSDEIALIVHNTSKKYVYSQPTVSLNAGVSLPEESGNYQNE